MDMALAPTAPEEGLRRLKRFHSRYFGVVRDIFDFLHYPDEPNLYTLGCNLCDFSPVLGKPTAGVLAGSYGLSIPDATARSIGEALERYAACFVGHRRKVFAPWRDLREDAVHPGDFQLFSDRQYNHPQFPYRRFTESTPTTWVEGYELPAMKPTLLPAQLVYLQPDLAPDEPRLLYQTSSGIALGSTPAQAVLSGLCELVERDAFVIAWENRLAFPRVDLAASGRLSAMFEEYFGVPGIELATFDYSAFLDVPTAVVSARPIGGEGVEFAVGAAAAPTIEQAMLKAVMEVYQTRAFAKLLLFENRSREFKTDYSDIKTFDDHVLYNARREHRAANAFIDSSSESVPLRSDRDVTAGDPMAAIDEIVGRLRRLGQRVYCVDITTPDLEQGGLTAAVVVSPLLARLSLGMGGRYLGAERLYREPARLGFRTSPSTIEELNKFPHPFP